MSERVSGQGGSGRREKRVLSPSEKYEIWLQLMRQEVTVGQVRTKTHLSKSTRRARRTLSAQVGSTR